MKPAGAGSAEASPSITRQNSLETTEASQPSGFKFQGNAELEVKEAVRRYQLGTV